MTTALELIRLVEAAGGRFMIDGDRLGIKPAEAAAPVLDELRKRKQELIQIIFARELGASCHPIAPPGGCVVVQEGTMETFTEMAEERIRANVPAVETSARAPSTAVAAAISDTSELDEFDPLDDLRPPFVNWFDSEIWLEVQAVVQRTTPRLWSGVHALHADFTRWMLARNHTPPTCDQFRGLLLELCLELRRLGEEEFVLNVGLREDMEAYERFQNPAPAPAKGRNAKLARRAK